MEEKLEHQLENIATKSSDSIPRQIPATIDITRGGGSTTSTVTKEEMIAMLELT